MLKYVEINVDKIEADNAMSKVIRKLQKAIEKKDRKAIEAAEEAASRIDLDLVDSELFSAYDELFSKASKI
jgi:hypothetical protein